MITTGSGFERFMYCRAANALHRAFDETGSVHSSRGIAAHKFLQLIGGGKEVEPALEEIDERFHDHCRAIDLDDLKDVLGLTAEYSFAYDPATDTARELGVALDREYELAGCQPHEIPMTLDVVGLDNPKSPSVGVVVDYKDGWGKITRAEKNWQLRGGALALSRVWDLDEVRVQLIHLREDMPAKRDRAVFTAADLSVFAAEARVRNEIALADRAAYLAGGRAPDATRGTWCRFCPSYHACDAQVGLIRALVSGDETADVAQLAMKPETMALAFKTIGALLHNEGPLKRAQRQIYAAAKEHPVLLETLDDGTEVFLGMTEVVGNEKLDSVIARDVVRDMLGPDAVDEVCTFTVTKGRIEDAAKKRSPRGAGASKNRAVIDEIRKRRGAHRPVKHDVDVYKVKRAQLAQKAG